MKKLTITLFILVFFNTLYSADIGNDKLDACVKAQSGANYDPKNVTEIDCSDYCLGIYPPNMKTRTIRIGFFTYTVPYDANAQIREEQCEIESLEGIQNFIILTKLNLSNHNVTDEASYVRLEALPKLQELILNNANLKSIPSFHTKLRKLEANNNQINNLDALAKKVEGTEFKYIRSLSLKNNQIKEDAMVAFYHMNLKVKIKNRYGVYKTKAQFKDTRWGSLNERILTGDGANLLVSELQGNPINYDDKKDGWDVNALAKYATEEDMELYLNRNILPDGYYELLKESIYLKNEQFFNDCIRRNGGSMYYIPSICYIYQE